MYFSALILIGIKFYGTDGLINLPPTEGSSLFLILLLPEGFPFERGKFIGAKVLIGFYLFVGVGDGFWVYPFKGNTATGDVFLLGRRVLGCRGGSGDLSWSLDNRFGLRL